MFIHLRYPILIKHGSDKMRCSSFEAYVIGSPIFIIISSPSRLEVGPMQGVKNSKVQYRYG